ncbi:lipoprotein-anchoring transpeptidase ErfK/SrfK [Loktanella ponticola]|uniref:Lipoprotein-anchoring transpeptidase ErfK/SrfK n=1 Tax=Yoonia ponticola TaxID=1524255 RepID=A0A7W9BH76_9RHOB|nr:L,D-transpeptidase [Yoonia ponticola]MBB5720435.1 lipoprotein-anchoring transpeptidase ErfK/SrfK [Yoonia ponticola]
MLTRRQFATTAVASLLASPAIATPTVVQLPLKFMPQEVDVNPDLPAGQIHVVKKDFFLYWTLGNGRARRYGIALGNQGRNYTGVLTIRRKAEWPSWTPTQNMINLEPELYAPYRRGLPGGHPQNPMGARALYLYDGGRDTYYRIHGTPQPWTIGQNFSSGCVRLINPHVEELYAQVPVNTHVYIF